MNIHQIGTHLGELLHNSLGRRAATDPGLSVVMVRAASGVVHVYATWETEDQLGTIEQRGADFVVAFAHAQPEPFRFHTLTAAVGYFAEFAWCRDLGSPDTWPSERAR
jgi:hypothetical protein